jgi:hypothetical protein
VEKRSNSFNPTQVLGSDLDKQRLQPVGFVFSAEAVSKMREKHAG